MEKLPPPPKSLTLSAGQSVEERMGSSALLTGQEGQPFGYGCNNRLDEQLQKLRREMVGLRQLDLSLLSQLNALRQSILEYKRILHGEGTEGQPWGENQSNTNGSNPPSNGSSNEAPDDEEDDLTDDEGGESTSTASSHSV